MAACVGCGESVSLGARFCSVCGRSVAMVAVPPPPPHASDRMLPRPGLDGLYRPREPRMIAGVCSGFALRYGWDLAIVRLVLVLGVLFGAGVPLIVYAIAWIVMPNGQFALSAGATPGGPGSMRV